MAFVFQQGITMDIDNSCSSDNVAQALEGHSSSLFCNYKLVSSPDFEALKKTKEIENTTTS